MEQAGLLRPEDQTPQIREEAFTISSMATLASGILAGPAGEPLIAEGDLVGFFAQLRSWYGNDDSLIGTNAPPDAEEVGLGMTRPTVFEAFNIYVPFKKATFDPDWIDALPPDFLRFLAGAGTTDRLASIIGPLGFGETQFLPLGQTFPYTVQFENAANAASCVSEIRIVTQLETDLEPRSVRLGDLKIGDIQVHIPSGRAEAILKYAVKPVSLKLQMKRYYAQIYSGTTFT